MNNFIYDYYKLYLGLNGNFTQYKKKNDFRLTKQEAYDVIDLVKDDYDEYMIVGHINLLNEDAPIEHERIEHYDKPKKKRRKK